MADETRSDFDMASNGTKTDLDTVFQPNGEVSFYHVDDRLSRKDYTKAKELLNEMKSTASNNPGYYARVLIWRYKCSCLSDYLYKNRAYSNVLLDVTGSDEWAQICALTPDKEDSFPSMVRLFCSLCSQIAELKSKGPRTAKEILEDKESSSMDQSFDELQKEAEAEYRRSLQRLEKKQWDFFTKMKEAEKKAFPSDTTRPSDGRESSIKKDALIGLTCNSCGANFTFERGAKLLVCPFCGKTQTLDEANMPASISAIDFCIAEGMYARAMQMIEELRKDTPDDYRLTLRELRCSLTSKTIHEGLHKIRKDEQSLKKAQDLDWNKFRTQLPSEKKQFVGDVKIYITSSLSLIQANQTYRSKNEKVRGAEKLTEYSRAPILYDTEPQPEDLKKTVIYILSMIFLFLGILIYVALQDDTEDLGPIIMFLLFVLPFAVICIAPSVVPGNRPQRLMSKEKVDSMKKEAQILSDKRDRAASEAEKFEKKIRDMERTL